MPCRSWSAEQEIIPDRDVEAQEVVKTFCESIDLYGCNKSSANTKGVIEKFKLILKNVAKNKVGCYLLKQIILILSKIPKRKLGLDTNNRPVFISESLNDNDRIWFSTTPIDMQVINDANAFCDESESISQEASTDLLLFHELLHWAHKLNRGIDEWEKMKLADTTATILTHSIFNGYPGVNIWHNVIKSKFYQIMRDDMITTHKDNNEVIVLNHQSQPWSLQGAKISLTDIYPEVNSDEKVYANRYKIYVTNIEEVRTIMGAGSTSQYELDQISENSYRMVYNEDNLNGQKLSLRCSHKNKTCKLTREVIQWIASRVR